VSASPGLWQHHYYAGFTGGRKAIMPGVCSRRSVYANHSLNLHPEGGTEPLARTGILDGNPVHEDMVEAARMVEPDFCVNVTAAPDGTPFAVFGGHFIDAHREACDWAAARYERECVPAQVVIAGAAAHQRTRRSTRRTRRFDNAFRAVAPAARSYLPQSARRTWPGRVSGLVHDVINRQHGVSVAGGIVVHGHTALRRLKRHAPCAHSCDIAAARHGA